MLKNRVLRKVLGSKRLEVTGGSGQLHNEKLHNLYASPNIIRVSSVKENEIGGARSTHGTEQKWVQNFDRKT
jgi:hypothetical protein